MLRTPSVTGSWECLRVPRPHLELLYNNLLNLGSYYFFFSHCPLSPQSSHLFPARDSSFYLSTLFMFLKNFWSLSVSVHALSFLSWPLLLSLSVQIPYLPDIPLWCQVEACQGFGGRDPYGILSQEERPSYLTLEISLNLGRKTCSPALYLRVKLLHTSSFALGPPDAHTSSPHTYYLESHW